jgi:7,8-dihydropterin-6-yl-methyl-4-(beta-D-ribofuranosyl)aminobenzene 5'-phosphate synthase
LSLGTIAGCLATTGVASTVFRRSFVPERASKNIDIGQCKSVKVTCISETSWFNNQVQMADFKKAGGALVSQYDVKFTSTGVKDGYKGDNAGGYSSVVDIEFLDGSRKKILLDTGWNVAWMTHRFAQERVDRMLRSKEIDLLFVSHDHYDHFWGIQATLQHQPDITIMIPDTFMKQSHALLAGASFPNPPIANTIPHTGKLIRHQKGKLYPLFPGVATAVFGVPCGRGVYGEEVLIFNLKDKGIATVTGCCHMGLITLLEYIKQNIQGGSSVYGVYGGLHVSPYEDWDPQNDDLVLNIPRYKVQRIGCNHCTGYITVEKMLTIGIPVIKGSARNLTKRDIYLGNGDTIEL